MEIGGYTDSQGREEMNQALSQRRADSVLSALLARRVLTSNLTSFGYGEENPIADNDTEEGREANRRIEFRLIGVEPEEGVALAVELGTADEKEPTTEDDPSAVPPPARPEDLVEETAAEDQTEGDEPADPGDAEGPQDEVAPDDEAEPQAENAPQDAAVPEDEADVAEDPADGEAEAAEDATEAVEEAPIVVHPELEGIRPQPRPDRDDG
jgi:OmpA-OmpF porin, OOP family